MVYGTIFDIKRFAIHDGPGIRTTVFFAGCPMDCWWCHNPEARDPGVSDLRSQRVSGVDIMTEIQRDHVFFEESGGGVTFSGGEPLMQPEFLCHLLENCKKAMIRTALDTTGYAPWEVVQKACALTDLVLYDLKLINDDDHIRYTGVSNELCLDNLARLEKTTSNVQVRVPMIPEITDTEKNLLAIAHLLEPLDSIRSISLLPYNKLGEDKRARWSLRTRLADLETQSESALSRRTELLRSFGYQVSIGG